MTTANDAIVIRGARTHNLKNISCDIPHGKLTVVSGVPRRRAAAERLPASATVTRIDIESRRSIVISEKWKEASHFYEITL